MDTTPTRLCVSVSLARLGATHPIISHPSHLGRYSSADDMAAWITIEFKRVAAHGITREEAVVSGFIESVEGATFRVHYEDRRPTDGGFDWSVDTFIDGQK